MKKIFTRVETILIDLKKEYPGLLWDIVRLEKAQIRHNRYLEAEIVFVLEVEDDRSERDTDRGDN